MKRLQDAGVWGAGAGGGCGPTGGGGGTAPARVGVVWGMQEQGEPRVLLMGCTDSQGCSVGCTGTGVTLGCSMGWVDTQGCFVGCIGTRFTPGCSMGCVDRQGCFVGCTGAWALHGAYGVQRDGVIPGFFMRCMGTGVTPKSMGHPKVLHMVLLGVHRDLGHPKALCGVHKGMGDPNMLAVVCGHHGVPHGVIRCSKVLRGVRVGLGDPMVLYGVHGYPEVLHYFHRSVA